MSRVALLDVNVLVALFDPDHVHHEAAHAWFAPNRGVGWATCPLTENGVVRVLSNPAYGAEPERPGALLARLRSFCVSGGHVFWPDDVSLRSARTLRAGAALSHATLTDLYLLALAVAHDGRLATFDRRIPVAAVAGAEKVHLDVIPA
ncbi:MAG: PIN domain-containing protein [Thermoanaerobaculia bacterium]|nr:PIN domain-containing protein [Thermoanaerobaculia bacterium]